MSTRKFDIRTQGRDTEAVLLAVRRAVRQALLRHKREGRPIAVWEDGHVKIVQPQDIVPPKD